MLHRVVIEGGWVCCMMNQRLGFLVGGLGVVSLELGLGARGPKLVVRCGRYWMRGSEKRVFA